MPARKISEVEFQEALAMLAARFPKVKPSPYQTGVFRHALENRGNGRIKAVAGSGKSTVLEMLAHLFDEEGVSISFNVHIRDEMVPRLKPTKLTAATIHQIALATLSPVLPRTKPREFIQKDKYRPLIREWMEANPRLEPEERDNLRERLTKMVDLARLTLTSPMNAPAFREMCDHFTLDFDGWEAEATQDIIEAGERSARRTGIIDFNDMLSLCETWRLQPKTHRVVLLDEAQDTNAAQQALALKMIDRGGRFYFVGDPDQSIYGFAGADVEAFDRLADWSRAEDLPLNVCYRCPSSHIQLAKAIVPHIEARDGAPEGIIERVKESDLSQRLQPGDMIMCRVTAPLISTCLSLIRQGVHARVRGQDIEKGLAALIRTTDKLLAKQRASSWKDFPAALRRYVEVQTERLEARGASEGRIATLYDQMEAILTVYEIAETQSAEGLIGYLKTLFDDKRPPILLTTIHGAKGLQNPRTFILRPDKLPLVWAKQQPWEAQQERNCQYIAYTRSQSELYFVDAG